ncbi:MAG TPA: glycosyltransferase family 39 protein, partial [Myxococcales bacterium]|nr:glycosyltransferase family 39 protein [Myxococcales bacterium]
MSGWAPSRHAWLAAGLAFAFALPGLGNLDGIGHPDEAFYLSVAADMADHGGWVPAQDGAPVYQKPPVVFWLARLGTLVFGRSAAAARLVGALAAAALCGAGVAFTAATFGASAAPLAGLFLVGCFGVARFSRSLMLDLPLAACLTGAMACLALALEDEPRAGRLLAAAGFLGALGLGVKGPIGPGLLLCTVVPLLALRRRLDVFRRGALWLGVALGVAVSLPWYVAMIAEHPHEMWAIHVVDQYFDRFAGRHGQPALNLLWGSLLYAAPFVPLAAVGLYRALRDPALRRRALPALCWIGAFAFLFGLPKEHGLHYPLLILAPLAALAAEAAASSRRLALAGGIASVAAAGLVALGIGVVAPALAGPLLPASALTAARGGAGLDVAFEHPGPVAFAAGVPARQLW